MIRTNILTLSIAFGALPITAISYSPAAVLSWEEVVERSTFVGIIECTQAGAAVSEFKVIEAWKGKIADTPFRFDAHTLVGTQLVVGLLPMPAEGERVPQLQELLLPIGGLERLYTAWPAPPAQYRIADNLNRSVLEIDKASATAGYTEQYGTDLVTVEDFRVAAKGVADSTGAEREALLIAAAMRSFLKSPAELDNAFLPGPWQPEPGDITQLDDLLAKLLAKDAPFEEQHVAWALGRAGGIQTLAKLDILSRESDAHAALIAETNKAIVRRLAMDIGVNPYYSLPSAQDTLSIREARRHLRKYELTRDELHSEDYQRWEKALALLTQERPTDVADYLADFNPEPFHNSAAAQNLASGFARNCSEDRTRCYVTLSEAKNPPIVAAGAFYLPFADWELGLA